MKAAEESRNLCGFWPSWSFDSRNILISFCNLLPCSKKSTTSKQPIILGKSYSTVNRAQKMVQNISSLFSSHCCSVLLHDKAQSASALRKHWMNAFMSGPLPALSKESSVVAPLAKSGKRYHHWYSLSDSNEDTGSQSGRSNGST